MICCALMQVIKQTGLFVMTLCAGSRLEKIWPSCVVMVLRIPLAAFDIGRLPGILMLLLAHLLPTSKLMLRRLLITLNLITLIFWKRLGSWPLGLRTIWLTCGMQTVT